MRNSTAFLFLWVLVPHASLSAQQQPTIEPGSRVRITALSLGVDRQTATFRSLTDETLTVVIDSILNYPRSAVTRLELYGGRIYHPWRGAGVGFVVGALVGAVIGGRSAEKWDLPTGQAVLAGAGFGGLIGTGVGAVSGVSIATDRWEEIPLDRLQVSLTPQRDGRFGIGLSVAF